MPKPRTEEQFPLLLLLVGDQEATQNNKRLFGRGRFEGITSGATAIITEWPNYLSSCWVTAFICGATLFLLTLMLTSCMTLQYHHRLPRCVPSLDLDNHTVHLVHSSRKWTQQQLELLDNITHAFPHYKVHLILIDNNILTSTLARSNVTELDLANDTKTLDHVLEKHPNILVTYTTYTNVFKDTPLFMNWVEMSDQMRIFATRIIQMWQYGGLSYDLLEFRPKQRKRSLFNERKLRKLIEHGRDSYEHMGYDMVSVDIKGLHMECRTPCHAFFGRVLMRLRKARQQSGPVRILNKPMQVFCQAGVVDKLFCHYQHVILIK